MINFRKAIYALLCLATLSLSAQSPYTDNIPSIIQSSEQLHKARIAFGLVRLSDGKTLSEYRVNERFTPASIVKVLSTGALLLERGRHYRYPTEIYTIGEIKNGQLQGALLIRGSGDPSIGTELIPGERYRFTNELLRALQERGIKEITGGIYLDASLTTGVGPVASWAKEDLDKAYGAGLYGLNYGDNQVGGRAEHNPAQSLASAIETRLRFAGIAIGKTPTVSYEGYEPEGSLLHTYYSQPLEVLASVTNHHSMNMYAEAIAQSLNPKQDRGSALSNYWRRQLGLSSQDISLADGSGLSRENQINARALSRALVKLFGGHTPEDGTLVATLPRLGYEGTLRTLMPNTHTKAYLKSGSMRGVATYIGYVNYGDDWYAIVYLTNGMPSVRHARGVFSAIVEDVFP